MTSHTSRSIRVAGPTDANANNSFTVKFISLAHASTNSSVISITVCVVTVEAHKVPQQQVQRENTVVETD